MDLLQFIVFSLFIIAFIAIIFEEELAFKKFKTSMFFGTVTWILLFVDGHFIGKEKFHQIEVAFHEYILEISMLWLFLISAMTFVAYLDKRGWIEKTIIRFLPVSLSEKKFLFIIGFFTFLFSGIADNLTATLVALSIILIIMKNVKIDTLTKFAVMIIFSANVGGLPLITGDVTTLMIFVAGKISMVELLKLYIPASVTFLVMFWFLAKGLSGNIVVNKSQVLINSLDGKIALIFILTIVLILLGHIFFHLPPVLVFLTGISVMFLVIANDKKKTKEEIKVLEYVQHVEFDALFFFLGVLLLVGALKEVALLSKIAIIYDFIPPIIATFMIGILSAIIDNIPITAAMLKADLPIDKVGWLLMTYAVGVGGSILVIGSAAGIVAMSKIKGLTFKSYMKYTPLIFFVYTVGFVITYLIA